MAALWAHGPWLTSQARSRLFCLSLNASFNPPTLRNMNLQKFHRLASGRVITAAGVVHALRIVKSQRPDTYYRETFTNPQGGTGRDVLRAFSGYCTAEINRRGGLVIPQDTPASFDRRQRKLCERARPSECKWCGSSVGKYVPDGRAFCDASCYRSFNS